MATGQISHNSWRMITLKALIKTRRKVIKTSTLTYTMLLAQERTSPKIGLSMYLLAVLGSQGIVVNLQLPSFSVPGHVGLATFVVETY